jgi:hypothetical protein
MNVHFWKDGGCTTNCDSILKFGRFISQLPELKINFILTKAIVTEFMCYFHCCLLVLYHSGVCSILVQNCTSSLLPHSVWSTKCPGFYMHVRLDLKHFRP